MTQTTVNVGAGLLGASISYAFGGWSELLSFFLLAIVIDIITGISASINEGRGISSAVGGAGLAKKALMFLAILIGHRMDMLMGTNVIMTGAVYFYLANELVSIVENYGRMGLPLPDGIKRIITVLKDRGDGGGKGEGV
jgi:toxin secretion/phage lysis holin